MSNVYSTRFWNVSVGVGGWTDLYTVPAGKIAVLRCFTATITASGDHYALTLNRTGHVVHRVAAANNENSIYDLRVVANAGDTFAVYIYTGGVNMTASGYLLDV